jgi:hypothetical protein
MRSRILLTMLVPVTAAMATSAPAGGAVPVPPDPPRPPSLSDSCPLGMPALATALRADGVPANVVNVVVELSHHDCVLAYHARG